MTAPARIATLYQRHAAAVRRMASRQARVPDAVIDDACQTAWTSLCEHKDVSLDDRAAVSWLVITAVRLAWRHGRREVTVGGWLPDVEDPRELPEPPGQAPDPLALISDRDEAARALDALTVREQQFLALQAAGLSYTEIAARLGVSARTVERQILRGRHKLRHARSAS